MKMKVKRWPQVITFADRQNQFFEIKNYIVSLSANQLNQKFNCLHKQASFQLLDMLE